MAFVLPMLQCLEDSQLSVDQLGGSEVDLGRNYVRSLVLAPTRELCAQISESFKDVNEKAGNKDVKVRAVYGGGSLNTHLLALQGGTDVLVATPGRLLDVMRKNACDLSKVEVVCLDEADRLLKVRACSRESLACCVISSKSPFRRRANSRKSWRR